MKILDGKKLAEKILANLKKEAEKFKPRLSLAVVQVGENLISQVFINLGMNLGLLPIIGIPLPLVSYGGSSLVAFFLGFGIIQSIKSH